MALLTFTPGSGCPSMLQNLERHLYGEATGLWPWLDLTPGSGCHSTLQNLERKVKRVQQLYGLGSQIQRDSLGNITFLVYLCNLSYIL